MKKLPVIGGVAAALILAGLGTVYYAASKAETDITAAEDWLQKELITPYAEQAVKITKREYHRGFFSAENVISIAVSDGIDATTGQAKPPVQLTLTQHISYGPFFSTPEGWKTGWYHVAFDTHLPTLFAAAKGKDKAFDDWIQKHADWIQAGYQVSFSEERQGYLKTGELKETLKDGQIELAPTTQRFSYTKAGDAVRYHFELPKLVASGKTNELTNFSIENLVYEGETEAVEGKFNPLAGNTTFRIGKLLAQGTEPNLPQQPWDAEQAASEAEAAPAAPVRQPYDIQLENLAFTYKGVLKEGFFDFSHLYELGNCAKCDKLEINKKPLKSAKIGIELNHIHAASVSGLNDTVLNMYKMMFASALKTGGKPNMDTLTAQMAGIGMVALTNVTTIAKNDPTFKISTLEFTTKDGANATASVSATLKGLTDSDIAGGNPTAALNKLFAESKASISSSLIPKDELFSQELEKLLKAGWLKKEGDKLLQSFKFEGGKITIFDKEYKSLADLEAAALQVQ